MSSDRRHFSRAVKRAAWTRCAGRCESCTAPLAPGKFHYDHDICWELSRNSSLENCAVLCVSCHGEKTAGADIPTIARVHRVSDRHHSIKGPGKGSRPLPAGRLSVWRKQIKGRVIPRETQAQKHRDAMARRYGGLE